MSIIDYIQSKIDLFLIKSTDFDTKLIKRLILINLLSIIQSKTVDLYRIMVEYEPKLPKLPKLPIFGLFRPKFDQFLIKSTFLGPNSNSNSNSDRDFE